jgi:hypothetical protein
VLPLSAIMDYHNGLHFHLNTAIYAISGALLVLGGARHLLKESLDLDGPPNPSWIFGKTQSLYTLPL